MKECAASVVFSENRDRVLLVKRCDVPIWVLPGGGIERGEEPEMAALREVREETGLEVEIVKRVAEYSPVNCFTSYTYLFECRAVAGSLTKGAESRDVAFFPIDELPYPFLHVHSYWLEDALENSPSLLVKEVSGASFFDFFRLLFTHPLLIARYLLARVGLAINSSSS